MSIEALCTGDVVIRQVGESTQGASFGNSITYTDENRIECRIDTVGGRESLKYQARGMLMTHVAMFSANPHLDTKHRLRWIESGGNTIDKKLHILNAYNEGPPGETQLWIVELSEESTKKETNTK